MSIQHLRDLAKFGVITDGDPFTLPPEAFTAGVNVRFRNGRITGGPVFRHALTLGTADPRYTFSSNPAAGLDLLFVGYLDGTISLISNGAETDYTLTGYTPSTAEDVWTHTSLAGVVYANREDRAPWYLRPADATFQNLATAGWDSGWRAHLIRSCDGAVVALNVTKSGILYPTMVKTSSLPETNSVPDSWDETDPATLATENILADMQGPIVDACSIGNDLIIYGLKEAWHMQADGSRDVYRYTKLPYQKGALNANCSVELGGKNVVFGPDDIWMHDGVSEKSICDKRTRDFIFGAINLAKSNRCFAKLNPRQNEVIFAYVSGDQYTQFGAPFTTGCNRQAVWNYIDDTWTFDDLPDVFSATEANLSVSLTYEALSSTYETVGGTYQDQEDGFKRTSVYVGDANTTYGFSTTLYAHDLYGQGSTVAYDVDLAATAPRFLEKDGIDLDELSQDLKTYKVLSSIYPQARLGTGAANLQIRAGASDGFNVTAQYGDYQSYNGDDLYKCDFNVAGRYLSLQILFDDYKEMVLTGLDFDLKATGRR